MPDPVFDGAATSVVRGPARPSDSARGQRVAAALRHGTIRIHDDHPYRPAAERDGSTMSGIGRELGYAGRSEHVEPTHIHENLAPAPSGWFGGTEPIAS
jgi:betaine-aldehyde dehydrogenase